MVKVHENRRIMPSRSEISPKSRRGQRSIVESSAEAQRPGVNTFRIKGCVVKIKRIKIETKAVGMPLKLKSCKVLLKKLATSPTKNRTSLGAEISVHLPTVQQAQLNPQSDTSPMTCARLNDCVETFGTRKCVVKIKRIKPRAMAVGLPVKLKCCKVLLKKHAISSKNNGSPASVNSSSLVKLSSELPTYDPTQLKPQSGTSPTTCAIENNCDESVFEPARNSTMCPPRLPNVYKSAKQPTASANRGHVTRATARPNLPSVTDEVTGSQKTPRFFHRGNQRGKSSIIRNVYEYLSQSTESDNEKRADPADDIIKKMVADGRADLVTRVKNGKFRVKNIKKRVRPVGKRKQCSLQSLGTNAPGIPNDAIGKECVNIECQQNELPMSPIYEPEAAWSSDEERAEPVQVPVQIHHSPVNKNQNKSVTEGAFSLLARSVLINQANTHTPENMGKRRELLDVARKFISTPVNRKSFTSTANAPALSPILTLQGSSRQAPVNGSASPWRVSDEASLPNTFVFGLNTSQLPSYSSDYIRRRTVYVPDEEAPPSSEDITVIEQDNDSNGENMSPPGACTFNTSNATKKLLNATSATPSGQENESTENFVHLPNPRRTLQHRSPLKDINILDVIVLPSWKKNAAVPQEQTPIKDVRASTTRTVLGKTSQEQPREELFGFEEFLNESALVNDTADPQTPPVENSVGSANASRLKPRSLFGFEDFLNEEPSERNITSTANANQSLHEKLQRLKAMRPLIQELPQVSTLPIRYAYDDPAAYEPRQRNIKDMFCSTMVRPPQSQSLQIADESRNLFEDMEPEVTFDEKKPRRTYAREQPKRKRKRHARLLFIESESSTDEDERDSPDKSLSPKRKPQKRTCNRKDAAHNAKLKEYVTRFNKECEEVDNFEMLIE